MRSPILVRHPWVVEIAIGAAACLFGIVVIALSFHRSLAATAVFVAGVALTLVIPGWCLAVIAFPVRGRVGAERTDGASRALDIIERTTLAIVFSITVTSGVVYVLSREVRAIGTPLTPRMLFGTLIAVTALLAVGAWARLMPRARLHAAATAVVILGAYAAAWIGTPVIPRTVAVAVLAFIAALTAASVGKRIAARACTRFPALVPFGRYAIIGAGNSVLDFTIYTALTRGSPFWSAHYLLANAVSFVIVVTWSFYWNRRWSFGNHERRHLVQYIRFVSATVVSLGIAESVLAAGVEFGLRDLLAKVLAAPLVVLWNFCMYRFWAFRPLKQGPTQAISERSERRAERP